MTQQNEAAGQAEVGDSRLWQRYRLLSWVWRAIAMVLFLSPVWGIWLRWNLPDFLHVYWFEFPFTLGVILVWVVMLLVYRSRRKVAGEWVRGAPDSVKPARKREVRSYPVLIFGLAGIATLLTLLVWAPLSQDTRSISGIIEDIWVEEEKQRVTELAQQLQAVVANGGELTQPESGLVRDAGIPVEGKVYRDDVYFVPPENYEIRVAGSAPAYEGTQIIARGHWWYDGTSPRSQHDFTLTVKDLSKGKWGVTVSLTPPPFLADE